MNLPISNFNVVLADPPWTMKTFSDKGLDGRPQHYDRMTLEEIKKMPVGACVAKSCHLFLWTTGPHLPQALEVMKAWGFKYSGSGFVWVKLKKSAPKLFTMREDYFIGMGYTTRKNVEFCLLGRKGNPKRISKAISELIIAPRREHSRKPDEVYERIESYADGPYLELFARNNRPGWISWGNETSKFD